MQAVFNNPAVRYLSRSSCTLRSTMNKESDFSAIYASVEPGSEEQECYQLKNVHRQPPCTPPPPVPYLTPKPGSIKGRKPPRSFHRWSRNYTTLSKYNRASDGVYTSVSRTGSKSSLKSSTPKIHKLSTLGEEKEEEIDHKTVSPTNSNKAIHILLVVLLLVSFMCIIMVVYTLASFESYKRKPNMDTCNCSKTVVQRECHNIRPPTSTATYWATYRETCSTDLETVYQKDSVSVTVSVHCESEVISGIETPVIATLSTTGSQSQCKCYLLPNGVSTTVNLTCSMVKWCCSSSCS